MTRFSRTLLATQCVIYLVTQVVMVWMSVPLAVDLAVGGRVPYGWAWQWITHPLVEPPGELVSFALAMFMAWYTYPRVETTYGRKLLAATMLAATALAGALGTAFAVLGLTGGPTCGAVAPVVGLVTFDAWSLRNAGNLSVLPLGAGPSMTVTGRKIVGFFAVLAVVFLLISRDFVAFGVNAGAVAGGLLVALLRERRRPGPRSSGLRIVRGGRNSGDGMLH